VNFGPLFRQHKFFGGVRGLDNQHLFPEFGERWSASFTWFKFFLMADTSDTFCWSVTEFGSMWGCGQSTQNTWKVVGRVILFGDFENAFDKVPHTNTTATTSVSRTTW